MAADFGEPNRKGKRKRDQTRPKLLSGEKVEVKSFEEGFLGSWHPGMVVHYGKLLRRVQYEHILLEDQSSHLVEEVEVSPLIDGVEPPDKNCGSIRPLPPSFGFKKPSLEYGQCVDSFVEDAWWEGVIFDHEDGSEERRIFFPDQGDDVMVRVENLRITQDWDERTEEWKPRGKWSFLELTEEFKKELPLCVSVKQIWYEVKEKSEIDSLKEWPFSTRDYWRELVSQVIFDNFKVTVDQFLGLLNSSERFVQDGPLLEFSESSLTAIFKPETFINDSLALVPFTKTSCKMDKDGTENENVDALLTPSNDEAQFLPLSTFPFLSHTGKEASGSLIDDYGEKVPSKKLKSSKRRKNVEWLPLPLEANFCPDAIIQFKRMARNAALFSKVRKHLLSLGWKIEFTKDSDMSRLRYFSPSGKLYMSLCQACNELGTSSESLALIPTTRSRDVSPDSSSDGVHITLCSSPEGSTSCPTVIRRRARREPSRLPSSEIIIDSKCCPNAVSDYLIYSQNESASHIKKGKLQLGCEAREHLVYSGWKVFNYSGQGRTQLRYKSPNGKSYYSLLAACKCYVEEDAFCPPTEERQSGNVCVETESHELDEQLPTELYDIKIQETLSLQNDFSGNLAVGTSPIMSPSKELVLRGDNDVFRRTKRKLSFHESRDLFDAQDVVTDTKPQTRVLRSSKRARQAALSSSHRTPRTVLSWLIDNNVVLPETIVQYFGKKDGPPLKEGRIARDGIKCNCCHEVYSLSNFETHAGSTNHSPSANIILEDGRSLLDCQLQMKHKNSVKKSRLEACVVQGNRRLNRNDHICSICHDGGQLILCDRCPSSFHTSCLGLKVIPDGDWYCPSCCCGICGQSRFNKDKDQITENRILCCYQCGHQYHFGCVRDKSSLKLDNYPKGHWFCNRRCERICSGLHQLLGKPFPVDTDKLTWTLLKYTKPNDSYYGAPDDEYITQNYSKLNVALSVMHECFEPVKESRTRRDLMEDVIFSRWSELNRLNFQGFYTVVLEKDDELITVATVRVHDEKVAEVPLVATRFQYRRHGMCRILMNELEKKLLELGVERLVLPAVSSALDTWTTSFGFSVMKDYERLNFLNYTFLDFHGTVMCQKLLLVNIPIMDDSSVSAETNQQSFNHINGGNADLDENIAISEVFQSDNFNESETVDQASLDPMEKNDEASFKCYQRRRMFQLVEAKVV